VSVAAQFDRAIAEFQSGRVERAAAICNDVVRAQPGHAGALHVLGILAAQSGSTGVAADYFQRALLIEPHDPSIACNLGNALRDLRQPAEALAAYQRALRAVPAFAGALYGAGNALMDLGRAAEAIHCFDQALALEPEHADAHNNRGNALLQLGRAEAALDSYLCALRLRPESTAILANSTRVLMQLRRYQEALSIASRRIALQPQDAEAWYARGLAMRAVHRHAEALADFDSALQLRPQSADILYRKAEALRDLRRHAEAATCFARVIELEPGSDYALGNLIQARLQICDWTDYAQNLQRANDLTGQGARACLPGAFQNIARSPAAQLTCARAFWQRALASTAASPTTRASHAHGRIRIAYLSADFREHPVAQQLVGVLEHHNRGRFEIYGISFAPAQQTAIGRRIVEAFEHWVEVEGWSDAAIASQLEKLGIDIAVDLMGFSAHGRPQIYARRPAPVQVNYLGYGGTMGTDWFDYLIADITVVPPSEQQHYSEKIAWLPGSYMPCDDRRAVSSDMPTRASHGLPENAFVYCCFNTQYKISPDVFDVWMELLNSNPDSVLWLSEANADASANLCREAALRGVDSGRLVFAPRVADGAQHLARYRLADLFLDTWPFGAHATACDALWAGLPVVTRSADTFVGRVAASLLTNCGLSQLVAADRDAYRRMALELGTQPARAVALRAQLARQLAAKAGFDTSGYCRHLEAAYAQMWARSQRREPPMSFAVSVN
jgi:predicted O-linked N-acetylglucosamine transferase (SPINDLY family)